MVFYITYNTPNTGAGCITIFDVFEERHAFQFCTAPTANQPFASLLIVCALVVALLFSVSVSVFVFLLIIHC